MLSRHLQPISLTVMLCCAVVAVSGASAQDRSNNDSDVKLKKFNVPLNIPDVPSCPFKCKLQSGAAKEFEEGISYHESFVTVEPKSTILLWYQSALTQNEWKIKRTSDRYISAVKSDGSYCSISADDAVPAQKKEARCTFRIAYFKLNPNRQKR